MVPSEAAVSKSVNVENTSIGDNFSSMASQTFPSRLHKFLDMVEDYNIDHIASWQPHGRGFRVHNPKEFVKITEPSWFVYNKYSSFQRQLHIYGFQRIATGIDKNCYYHKHFLRGQPDILHQISRCPVKNWNPSSTLPMPPQPNFYAMVPLSASSGTITNNQLVRGDNATNDGRCRQGNATSDDSTLQPQSISQFIQNHRTHTRDALIQSSVTSSTPTQHNSDTAAAGLSALSTDPAILLQLRLLQDISARTINPGVLQNGNNLNTSILSQMNPEQLGALLNQTIASTPSDTNATSTLLSVVHAQLQQNLQQQQLLQSIINRAQIVQLCSRDEQQQRSLLEAITSLQQGLRPLNTQRILEGQATSSLNGLSQNQLGRNVNVYEQILRNSLLPVATSQPLPNIDIAQGGAAHFEGASSSLMATAVEGSSAVQRRVNENIGSDNYSSFSRHCIGNAAVTNVADPTMEVQQQLSIADQAVVRRR